MLFSFLLSIADVFLKWYLGRKVAEFERVNHYDMGYARTILSANPQALIALHRAAGLGQFRGPLSTSAQTAVKLVGTLHEDCGPCLQLGVTLGLRAGVPQDTIARVISGEPTGDQDTDLVVNFARAVLSKAPEEAELRQQVIDRYGQDGLTAVAFSLTGTRMYPMLKAVLGYAQCYPVVQVGQRSVRLHDGRSPRTASVAMSP
jgi:hypothetical protein